MQKNFQVWLQNDGKRPKKLSSERKPKEFQWETTTPLQIACYFRIFIKKKYHLSQM